jgi:hypothetical protein
VVAKAPPIRRERQAFGLAREQLGASDASSAAIFRPTVGWLLRNCRAAPVRLPVSATAMKTRQRSQSIVILFLSLPAWQRRAWLPRMGVLRQDSARPAFAV